MNVADSEVVRTLLYEDGLREADSASRNPSPLNNVRTTSESATFIWQPRVSM